MGVRNRAFIAQSLIDAGRKPDEPVAFVESGATPRQRVIVSDLRQVASPGVTVRNPAVFVIGEVVKLRNKVAVMDAPLPLQETAGRE
jgi:uroporphyrin-III C-methyltransferase